ncbi:NAD(P)/FAD-dependent oxidoreductase [Actinoplanes italicus]|uniref:Thioredoxin reductase n=1 Tax=Actinoplanes italicus TaxID=113567 RepID=A0A2T0K206_9ACTN|nr:NAD(P)/FAD-dependent oxidoreductase [Actinoplanes italicus]PRX16849.1 thioredoxin reductase [Actinoplanes italicus]
MNEYDVVVVGGGAAGLSAALVLTRARRRVAVIDAGRPRNAPAAHMHGYLSRDGMPPADFLAAGRAEIKGYGGELLDGTVTAITPRSAGFRVGLASGGVIGTRRVLVATGLRDEIPAIPGLADRWGRDVLHCPYCHGFEVRDRPLGVLGGSPETVRHALLIRQWSADVTFFAHTHELSNDDRQRLKARDIRVVEGVVTRLIIEGDRLAGIELDRASVVAPYALFVRPRLVPTDALLTGLGAVLTDERTGRTTVPGVWAAGNAVDPRAQVITAAGAGSAAAIDINADLVEEDVRDALPFSAAQERQVAALVNRLPL